MKILALDQATRTGWATNATGIITAGVEDFSTKPRESSGMKYVRFQGWLRRFIAELSPALVIFEAPYSRFANAAAVGYGFASHIEAVCSDLGVEYSNVKAGTIKKHATGNGNAKKDKMLAAAREKWAWMPIEDDNQADAMWLLDYAMKEYGE